MQLFYNRFADDNGCCSMSLVKLNVFTVPLSVKIPNYILFFVTDIMVSRT